MRILSLICFALAAIVLAADLLSMLLAADGTGPRFTALGEVWYRIHPQSLQLLQPAVERHVSTWLWDFVMQPILTGSLALELAILGGLFWVLRRRTRPKPSGKRNGLDLSRR